MKNKNLKKLLTDINFESFGKLDLEINKISDNSKKVTKNDLFVAIKGQNIDSHKFIGDAIKKGAIAVMGTQEPNKEWLETTYIKVKDSREALAILASNYYKNPSKNMTIVGVTGSDGKTTTTHMIYEILKKAGKKVGLISSIEAKIGNKDLDTGFHVTNPEPLELHKFMAQMQDKGIDTLVLEVTSHGIDQKRVHAINFDYAVITNITHEHIDYHKSFENYRDTKLQLFLKAKTSILNKDDESYKYMFSKIKNKKISYSISNKTDLNSKMLELDKLMQLDLKHIGEYNISNALSAASVAKDMGINLETIRSALAKMSLPKGRLEKVKNNKGLNIYIDFAHTPNSLEKVLTLLNKTTKGKLITVFGCASERDEQKRPMMAEISTKLADISIFTAEDPRSEDINKILSDMEKGVQSKNAEYYKIPERGEAITFAINKLANKGDTVGIFGKAHETSMAYFGVEYPWSDFEAVEMALKGKTKKIIRKK